MRTLRDGEKVNNTYKIIRFLGKGSFAEVYQAEHILMHHTVAVKILIGDTEPDAIQRFLDEARVLASIKHEHIIPIYECGVESSRGIPFLIVEYAPNGSLRDRHPKGTRVPLTTVLQYVIPIASALQYAHEHGIIHTDVKPENVLVGKQNNILLSDFGLAQRLSSSSSLSLQMLAGTPLYMAPEQITGHPKRASDQYSLAMMVYEWLSGTYPFDEKSGGILHKQLYEPPSPLYSHIPGVSLALQDALFKALAKDPKDRYPCVQMFADALVTIMRQEYQAVAPLPNYVLQGQQRGTPLSAPVTQRVVFSPPQLPKKPIISRRSVIVLLAATATIIATAAVAGALVEQSNLPLIAGNPPHGVDVPVKSKPTAPTSATTVSQAPINVYTGHTAAVKSVAWSPDGTQIASGSIDGTVHIWEAKTGAKVGEYSGHTYGVRTVSWSPDGKLIASGDLGTSTSGGVVRVWRSDTLQDIALSPYIKHTGEVRCVAWSPSRVEAVLASSGDDGAIYVWNPLQTDQGTQWKPLQINQEKVLSVAWSYETQDPPQLAASDWNGQLYLWNVSMSTAPVLKPQSQSTISSDQTAQVWNVAWSPVDNIFAAVSNDGSLHVWTWSNAHDRFERSMLVSVQAGKNVTASAAYSVAWSPDGKYIATGSGSGFVQIWKMGSIPQFVFTFQLHTNTVWWLAWSPDGTMLASASEDQTVVVSRIQK